MNGRKFPFSDFFWSRKKENISERELLLKFLRYQEYIDLSTISQKEKEKLKHAAAKLGVKLKF
jgi:3-hydroxyisobutyrate dehydrogenase-like beta-hydroxyacid dehydrogenase